MANSPLEAEIIMLIIQSSGLASSLGSSLHLGSTGFHSGSRLGALGRLGVLGTLERLDGGTTRDPSFLGWRGLSAACSLLGVHSIPPALLALAIPSYAVEILLPLFLCQPS